MCMLVNVGEGAETGLGGGGGGSHYVFGQVPVLRVGVARVSLKSVTAVVEAMIWILWRGLIAP